MYIQLHMHVFIQVIYFLDSVVFSNSLLMIECCMLNCLSTFPVTEISQEKMNLLMTLLYTHLEAIPNLDKPQNMVIIHCVNVMSSLMK